MSSCTAAQRQKPGRHSRASVPHHTTWFRTESRPQGPTQMLDPPGKKGAKQNKEKRAKEDEEAKQKEDKAAQRRSSKAKTSKQSKRRVKQHKDEAEEQDKE